MQQASKKTRISGAQYEQHQERHEGSNRDDANDFR